MSIEQVEAYLKNENQSFVERLLGFLRIPSISTDPSCKDRIRQAADWVREQFERMGIESEICETAGHPCVLADSGPVDAAMTVLIYGHYDVQPAGDESLWKSGPFEPTIRNGKIVARGAADNKGQVLTHVFAAEAWMKAVGKLPVRVKFLIEGEEEVGSPNLEDFVVKHKDRLACDYVALSDTAQLDEGQPAITYGTKGLLYKEINVFGPKQDLHSGSFGGTIENPGNVIGTIVAAFKDADHRVTIPGFYDDVREITESERGQLESLPLDDGRYLEMVGSPELDGEKGYSTVQRRWTRPTLDVNGLYGGFQGEGASTIIPAKCGVKVSMRLVPDQDPEKISKSFDEFVRKHCPSSARLEIKTFGMCPAYVADLESPGMRAAAQAVEAGFGKAPVFIREGGTLPILPLFKQVLCADSLMMGFCQPNCNAHGPNEFFHLRDFENGIRTSAHFYNLMSRIAP